MKLNPLQIILFIISSWLGYKIYYLGVVALPNVLGSAQFMLPVMGLMLVCSSYRFNFFDVLLFILMPICYLCWTTGLGLTIFLMDENPLIECVGISGMLLLRILDYKYHYFIGQSGIIINNIPADLDFLFISYALCLSIVCLILWAIKVAR